MEDLKKGFWTNFNEKLLAKINEVKAHKKVMRHYRTSAKMDKDFAKEAKRQGLDKTEVINARIVEFTYGNRLRVEGAIKIISQFSDGVISDLAKLALEDDEQKKYFINYLKDQCKLDDVKQRLIKKHGEDVISTIINSK